MSFTYAVLGAGRQGTAAAFDLGRWGDAGRSRVVAANADGAALLRLDRSGDGWALDAAMPALARLREFAHAPVEAEPGRSEHLLFWTPHGARGFACEIRRASRISVLKRSSALGSCEWNSLRSVLIAMTSPSSVSTAL